MIDDVAEILKTEVPDLRGRVEGALQLAPLIEQNALPQVTPAAFVIPAGVDGGAVDLATGSYRQRIGMAVAVVIVLRAAGGPKATRAIDPLDALIWQIIKCLAGREIGDALGVLTLRRAFLVTMRNGAPVYQIEFSLSDQLRIDR